MQKIFPIVITLLALLAAYVFYAVWHTKELNPPSETIKTKVRTTQDLSNKVVTPKNIFSSSKTTLPNPKPLKETKNNIVNEINKQEEIIFHEKDEMEKETQNVYHALMPKEHDTVMQVAQTHYRAIESEGLQIDESIMEEESHMEEIE